MPFPYRHVILDAAMNQSKKALSRRRFLASYLGLGVACAALLPEAKLAQAAVPDPRPSVRPARNLPVLPPGAASLESYGSHCTGCQLCVSVCPHHVLRSFDRGLGALQPALSFESGYCHPECVACSQVCPTGALQPVLARVKKSTQIGCAVLHPERCRIRTEGKECTECARHCPAGAVMLVDVQGSRMPLVDEERCTGCGACEFHCPVGPEPAIRIEGNAIHVRV